jgi:hypothetical protein
MRVRIFGQYIQSSIAALAAIEMLVLLSVMILAVLLRFQTNLAEIEADVGPLWPRMLLFSLVTKRDHASRVAVGPWGGQ